jgi:hypothetical protein
MPTPHQMPDLAFHLRTSGPVVGLPDQIGLPCPTCGQVHFVRADTDRPTGRRRGALATQRAAHTGETKLGGPGMTTTMRTVFASRSTMKLSLP